MGSRIAFITGATSGIGKATAELFAKNDFKLIICGRRKERLEALTLELSKKTEVKILSFDVKNREEVINSIGSLPEDWRKVDVLVNNAGNAHGLAPIHTADVADWDAMMDINVKGLLYVSRELIPGMVERKSGHVVNIGSVAGKQPYANGSGYCGSKFAVDAITDSMRLDLNPYGIKVTGIHPGLVDTEFSIVRFKGDKERADNVYKGIQPLVAEDIADVILFAITRPAHVVIADLLIFPTAQASATTVHRQ